MPRAAIYARYSSDLQSPRSIDDQIALCRAWCGREGHDVAAAFSDAALSGASIKGRPGLAHMIAAAGRQEFDLVIVEAFDRIARSQSELPHLWEMLNFMGVSLVAVDDGAANHISIGVRGLVGALYLTDLAAKTRRGLAGKLSLGQRAGGLPFGYVPIQGRPGEHAVEPEKAAIVLRIFEAYADGASPRDIAGALNRDGIAPPRGRAWNASTIHGSAKRASGMICNEVYRGTIVWNRVGKVKNPATGKRVPRINPQSEWRRVEAPSLRIVPEPLWLSVQAMLAHRRQATRRAIAPARRPLSGLLRCAACGSSIVSAGSKRGRPIAACSRGRESGDCRNTRRYPLDTIEAMVLEALREELSHPSVIEAARRAYTAEWAKLAKERMRDRSGTERKLQDTRRKARRIVDMLAEGEVTGRQVGAKLAELEAEIEALEGRLAGAEEATVVTLHPKAIDAYLAAVSELQAALDTGDAPSACVKLRELVDHVVVHERAAGERVSIEIKGRLATLMRTPLERPGVLGGWGSVIPPLGTSALTPVDEALFVIARVA